MHLKAELLKGWHSSVILSVSCVSDTIRCYMHVVNMQSKAVCGGHWQLLCDSNNHDCHQLSLISQLSLTRGDWDAMGNRTLYWVVNSLWIISITWYRDIDRGFVELAISQRPDMRRYHARTHAREYAVRLTMQNGDNYLKDGHFMPPEKPWIDGHWAKERRSTVQHVLRAAVVGGP